MSVRLLPLLTVIAGLSLVPALSGCLGIPEGARPVQDFEVDRYLGSWYEIARLDHSFERGLTDVTATYEQRDDGAIRVVNRGWDTDKGEWDEAVGKAKPLEGPDVGRFKVSFFGPFYGAYNVIALDDDYQWALIAGYNTDYLWILARDPELDPAVLDRLKDQARRLGYPTDELIFPTHERAG